MTKLTTRGWLILGIAALLIGNIAWRVYAGWGLVTIQADSQPLGSVILDIERQAHVSLRTDLDPQTPVRLRVHKISLTEALERLSIVTDARWRLVYVVASDAPTIRYGLNAWQAGDAPTNWRWIDHPSVNALLSDDVSAIPDPRRYAWKVKAPASGNRSLQTYLDRGSRVIDAAFFIPSSWNPAVNELPGDGQVNKVAPRLAQASGGTAQEIFVLMKPRRGAYRIAAAAAGEDAVSAPAADDATAANANARVNADNEPRRGRRNPQARAENTAERTQERINQLPSDQRAAAQAEFDAEQEFWLSLRDLPAAERAEKLRDHFNDASVQERLEARNATRDAMRTPEQRLERARQFVQRRAAAQAQQQQAQRAQPIAPLQAQAQAPVR